MKKLTNYQTERKKVGTLQGKSLSIWRNKLWNLESCIRNELGEIVWWCDEHTHQENVAILAIHSEWYLSCEQINY